MWDNEGTYNHVVDGNLCTVQLPVVPIATASFREIASPPVDSQEVPFHVSGPGPMVSGVAMVALLFRQMGLRGRTAEYISPIHLDSNHARGSFVGRVSKSAVRSRDNRP